MTSSSTFNRSPFNSVNDCLIQNKCWICLETFKKGKMRKVFTVLDVLRFLHDQYVINLNTITRDSSTPSDDIEVSIVSNESSVDDSLSNRTSDKVDIDATAVTVSTTVAVPLLSPIVSKNLSNCLIRYAQLEGNKDAIANELKDCEIATWMSGLACVSNETCTAQFHYIMPSSDSTTARVTSNSVIDSIFKRSDDGECLPGCGCDNPWPFLSSK